MGYKLHIKTIAKGYPAQNVLVQTDSERLSSPKTSEKHSFIWLFFNFMWFHEISWDFMWFHGISWDIMGFHVISCEFFLFFLEILVFLIYCCFLFMCFPAHLFKQPQPWNGLSSQTTLHIQWAVQPIILWAFQPNYYTFLGPSLNCEHNHFKYSMGPPAQPLQFELALPDIKFILVVLSSPDQNKLTQI